MCAIDGCYETYAVWNVGDRRAAKPHKCGECGRDIAKGETYRYTTGLYDGHWTTNHVCQHCTVAAEWLRINCGGYLDFGVYDDIHEHAEEYPDLAVPILRVCVGMRRKWKALRGDGLMRAPRLPPSIESVVKAQGAV